MLAAVALLGTAWALFLPPFQAPDEPAHFAYVQSLVERQAKPGDPRRPPFSSQQQLFSQASNAEQTEQLLRTKPEWSRAAEARWRSLAAKQRSRDRSDGGGPNPAGNYPPAYYLTAGLAYTLAVETGTPSLLYPTRMASVVLLLVTVFGAWMLAGEVFRDPRLRLVAASIVGLWPMETFVSSSVTPDALLFATWSLALWLGARILRRGATAPAAAGLIAAVLVAVLTKPTSLALLPAVVVVGAVEAKRRGLMRSRRARALWAAAGSGALVVIALYGLHRVNSATGTSGTGPRGFLSYLWQFYLPNPGFLHRWSGGDSSGLYHVWIQQGWAAFGWLEIRLPGPLYPLFAALTFASVGLGILAWVRQRRRGDGAVALFLAAALVALAIGVHLADFNSIVRSKAPLLQARYLFPALPVLAVCAASSLSLLSRRTLAAGLVLAGLLVFQWASLATIAGRFYA